MSERIKIMIVDDHEMVRFGLRTYLTMEDDLEVVTEASDGEEAVRLFESGLPDEPNLVLLDLHMPRMNGVETAQRLMAIRPGLRIVMLTSFLEDDQVVKAIEAGAVSYVLKTVSSEELVMVIRNAAKGMQVMRPEVSQALARGLRQRMAENEDEEFTPREKEVLLLIAEGKSNKEIADELHISIKTVKTHVSNLLMKCELEDRTQLAVLAHRKGWVGA
ncbi:response regulator [Paenibacillus thermoaerophilus]|jgi:NarL family two-component system response regulator LiaR|uniref:Response regulator n=1 Tax=Paenibacillus thermoaerophilus TaxID=1215385 RepID=A0ABW2V575_9BACL|nr:response regulator transcription factor [Paenibacillus thermoaerophilus]TMV18476.1 response regulator transcription factor [Paenibacillus thermoaerophilus]